MPLKIICIAGLSIIIYTIYGSVNLQVKDEYDNNATINGVLGYGRIKLGLQITRNENILSFTNF